MHYDQVMSTGIDTDLVFFGSRKRKTILHIGLHHPTVFVFFMRKKIGESTSIDGVICETFLMPMMPTIFFPQITSFPLSYGKIFLATRQLFEQNKFRRNPAYAI